MVHLTLVELSADGTRLLLVDDQGAEFTLDVDPKLRAALRGDNSRLGTLEIDMDSALRPRDIQNRIRAGETPEAVAAAAQTTVEKIMPYAGPVLAEREHMAGRAQRASVRRVSDTGGSTGAARSLGDAVAAHLRSINISPDAVTWDSARREDGRWTLTASWAAGKKKGLATYSYDNRGNFVVADNDDARWLIGDVVEPAPPAAPASSTARPAAAKERRLSAVPTEELPLGDDAIEMVSGAAEGGPEETVDLTETAAEVRAGKKRPRRPREEPSFFDAVFAREEGAEPARSSQQPPEPSPEPSPEPAAPEPEPVPKPESVQGPAASEPAARPARKKGARASVPSWDEIMFGGGPSKD